MSARVRAAACGVLLVLLVLLSFVRAGFAQDAGAGGDPAGQAQAAEQAQPPVAAPRPGDEAVRRRAQEILQGQEYTFCHDEKRWVRPSELRYCGYLDETSQCPAFAKACERMSQRPPSCGCANPGASTGVGRYVGVVFLVGFALGLAFLVVRGLIRARRAEALVDRVAARVDEAGAPVPVPMATPAELLARALESHARGEQRAALYQLYAALLRKLEERGEVRIDPVYTNGDYVRQCREPELRARLRDTVREVDRARFGGAEPEGSAVGKLIARVEPVVRAAGVVLLALALASALPACKQTAGPGGREGTADASPQGHRAVRALLTAEGLPAHVLAEAPEGVKDTARVLVLDAARVGLEREQWTSVLEWVGRGGRLVLAGGAEAWPEALHVSPAREPAAGAEVQLDAALGGAHARVRLDADALKSPVEGYVVASFMDGSPYAALVDHGAGRVLVLGGDDLFTNGGLAVETNAAATVALARSIAEGRELYFVESAAGAPRNPLVSLARAGLLPAVLQGLLALGLFYLMAGRHFGTPRDRATDSRRAFAEHVRAVGRLYARSNASRAALRAYATLVLERVRERVAVGRGSLAEAIAARVGEPREEVERAVEAAERARSDEALAGADPEDLRLIKRLNRWYRALG